MFIKFRMTESNFSKKSSYSILLISMFGIIIFIPSLIFIFLKQSSYASGMLISSSLIILLTTLTTKQKKNHEYYHYNKILMFAFFF